MMSAIQKIDELISDIDSGGVCNGCPGWIVSEVLIHLKELRSKSELSGFEDQVNQFVRGACRFIGDNAVTDCDELGNRVYALKRPEPK